MEAGRRLSDHDEDFVTSRHLPPEQRLLKLIESLLQRLSAERAWIAKLLTRELVDPARAAHNYAASGLERDFVLLQAVMRDLLGAKANSEAIRLHALSVIGECVLYCLAGENLNHALIQLAVRLTKPGAVSPISHAAFAGGSRTGRGRAGGFHEQTSSSLREASCTKQTRDQVAEEMAVRSASRVGSSQIYPVDHSSRSECLRGELFQPLEELHMKTRKCL